MSADPRRVASPSGTGGGESRVTLKGRVIAEIVAGNPEGRLKSIEYGSLGEIRRIEWEYETKENDDA